MSISQLIAEEAWSIPPKLEAEGVGLLNRLAVGLKDIWVARIGHPKEKALIDMMHEALPDLDIKTPPKLLLFHDHRPHVFSLAPSRSVLFSTGIVDSMPHEELTSVMSRELARHTEYWRDMPVGGAFLTAARGVEDATGLPVKALTVPYQYVTGWLRYLQEYRSDNIAIRAAGAKARIEALESSLTGDTHDIVQEAMQRQANWNKRILKGLNKMPTLTPPKPLSTSERIERILTHAPSSFRKEYLASKAADAAEHGQGV